MATKGSLSVLGIEEEPVSGPTIQGGGTIDSSTAQITTQTRTTSNLTSQEVPVEQSETVAQPGETLQEPQTQAATPGVLGTGSYYTQTAPLTSSWENKAEQQSGIKFQQDVLAGKQTMLRSAQEAQAKGQEMQTQLALGEYMRGQSTEKAGWTGGYMLDQKRQGDYLKASIQAQMYGAQELQRYGMDTQLEAARLAYDLGKEQLAYQLYQQEYQKSITEAQMFGYYVSPENRDLLNQLRASQAVLSDVNATEEEKARATVVKTQIDTWFGEQNLDPNDISKFAEITMEREQWNQAKLDAVLATINDDPSTFIARNPDGSYAIDPATGQYLKLNFDDISSSDLATFLSKDDGSDNKFADATFRSYAKYLAQSTINDYFSSLGEGVAPTAEGFKTYLATAGADKLQAFRDKNPELKATIDAILASNFSPTLTRGGVTITYGRDGVGSTSTGGGTTTPTVNETEPQTILKDYVNPITEKEMTWESFTQKYNSYFKATNSLFSSNTLNANDLANLYKEDYDFYSEIKNGNFLNFDYDTWSKKLHRTHNTFSDKNYGTYLDETIKLVIKNKTGIDNLSIKFEDQQTKISVPAGNVTKDTESKLLNLGFVLTQGNYVLSAKGGIPNVSGYTIFSGWNDKYGYESANQRQYLLYNLIKT